MRGARPRARLRRMRLAALLLTIAEVLFPTPIHLTRQIHDSISGSQATVEQYCYANRVVFVNGPITTITDYGNEQVIEIDRAEGTYSITRFEDVARALRVSAPPNTKKPWNVRAAAIGGREAFEAERNDGAIAKRVRVAIDRSVPLSRDALDALIGSAYPGNRKDEDEVIVQVARSQRSYALPLEQHIRFEIDGNHAEVRDVVTRVGDELAPPELVAIPPDAKQVESRLVLRARAVEALDALNDAGKP